LIRAGRVGVNGTAQRDPETRVTPGRDRIEVDGGGLPGTPKAYWMLNKPRGVLTTTSDEKGRQTVYAYLPKDIPWLAPVGRLDKASEGLLLLTNDSEWAAQVTSPAHHIHKTYHVQINRIADPGLIQHLRSGVQAEDREWLCAKSVEVLRQGEKNSWLTIVLEEGKNRQIRRMLQALGVEVLRLVRVAIGELWLGDLAKGESRQLTLEEKRAVSSERAPSEGFAP